MYEEVKFEDVKVGDRIRATLEGGDKVEGEVTEHDNSDEYLYTRCFSISSWDTKSLEREVKPLEPGVYESDSTGVHSYLAVFPDGSVFYTAAGGAWIALTEETARKYKWEYSLGRVDC